MDDRPSVIFLTDLSMLCIVTNAVHAFLPSPHVLLLAHTYTPIFLQTIQSWSKFASRLSDFKHLDNRDKAVQCLNHLITDTLKHVPDVLEYMSKFQNQSLFHICALPAVW